MKAELVKLNLILSDNLLINEVLTIYANVRRWRLTASLVQSGTNDMRLYLRFLRCALIVGLGLAVESVVAAPRPSPGTLSEHSSTKARLIVLTDIGAEADDTESIVRLLLYSDVIDIQGLIASTSIWRPAPEPELIHGVIRAYGDVQSNLLKHDSAYPSAETLNALVKRGLAEYGMKGVGPGKDSEGSDWIIRKLEEPDDRPLWIAVWGGPNTLAQALYKMRATRTAAELDRLVAKLRVYTISDQDDSGPWIRKNFPKLFYIVSPGGDYAAGTWAGINSVIAGIDNSTISNQWLAEHIQQGHGALGAAYPDVAYGMEGDTPSWLALIPNGLSVPEHPDWGGWGGRYELYQPEVPVTDPKTFIGGVPIAQEVRPIWTNATDSYTPAVLGEFGRAILPGNKTFRDFKATLWRWRDDFQNDFAARMEWCTKPYRDANHPPVVLLDQPAAITVRSGSHFALGAHATDPDGDSLTYYWFQYPEAGTYKGTLDLGAQDMPGLYLAAPKVDKPETIHLIVRVSDKGKPPLSRYSRVILTVIP
jgi:hypothetical protein